MQRLRYHLMTVVKRCYLSFRETFASGELLYLEVSLFDGGYCDINSKFDHVLNIFDLCGDIGVACDCGIA